MIAARAVRQSIRYEATRLTTHRSTFGLTALAVFGSALITLPAARVAVTAGSPAQHVAWVVAGGSAGAALPGTAAALGAAFLGAGLVIEDYRYGLGLSTYARLPRRGAGLLGKLFVAVAAGLCLLVLTRSAAFLTALGGFALAHSTATAAAVSPGYALALPTVTEAFFAALGGASGVLLAGLVRARVLVVPAAWALGATVAAFAPHTSSPYTRVLAGDIARIGLPVASTAAVLPALLVLGLAGASRYALSRRRVD